MSWHRNSFNCQLQDFIYRPDTHCVRKSCQSHTYYTNDFTINVTSVFQRRRNAFLVREISPQELPCNSLKFLFLSALHGYFLNPLWDWDNRHRGVCHSYALNYERLQSKIIWAEKLYYIEDSARPASRGNEFQRYYWRNNAVFRRCSYSISVSIKPLS